MEESMNDFQSKQSDKNGDKVYSINTGSVNNDLSNTFSSSSNFESGISEISSVFCCNDDCEFNDDFTKNFETIQKEKQKRKNKAEDDKPISCRLKSNIKRCSKDISDKSCIALKKMLWETDYDRVDTSKPRSMKIYNKLGKYCQLINNRKPIKCTRMEFLCSKLSNKYMNIFQKFINEINTDMKSSEEQNQVEVSQEIQQGTSHNEEIENVIQSKSTEKIAQVHHRGAIKAAVPYPIISFNDNNKGKIDAISAVDNFKITECMNTDYLAQGNSKYSVFESAIKTRLHQNLNGIEKYSKTMNN